ncbi:hypothetical protein, partial [Paenibacillus sabuli]|uniref:hypothetical protein n=1 Tax=Paenibacillus sabuli TaxID=2772509 RepID=UPI001CC28256
MRRTLSTKVSVRDRGVTCQAVTSSESCHFVKEASQKGNEEAQDTRLHDGIQERIGFDSGNKRKMRGYTAEFAPMAEISAKYEATGANW